LRRVLNIVKSVMSKKKTPEEDERQIKANELWIEYVKSIKMED